VYFYAFERLLPPTSEPRHPSRFLYSASGSEDNQYQCFAPSGDVGVVLREIKWSRKIDREIDDSLQHPQSSTGRQRRFVSARVFYRTEFMPFFRLITFALSLALSTRAAARLSGEVVRVDDGDTLILLDAEKLSHTVRLLGIDAPELGQESGAAARSSLSRLARGRAASVECRAPLALSVRFCVVRVDGKDLGLAQIANGMAWRWPAHAAQQTPRERADYDQAELMAKLRRLGLWKAANPTPPWTWRGKRPEQ
jgi:endonuclease YncB( thermonuclease family)